MEKLLTKTILILSAGLEAIPIIQKAKSMGCYVVVLDGYESAPGIKYADDLIISSTFDVAGSVEKAKNYSQNKRTLDGVMSAGHDAPHTVAHIAHALALAGVPVATAEMAVDKVAMKDKFAKDGVAIPWYSSVDDFQHLQQLVKQHGLPLVIKPVDGRGARGVLRLSDQVDLEWAYNYSVSQSGRGQVMVERFLSGPQISTESMVINGQTLTPGFSDRNYELMDKFAPFIIENGGDLPSFLSQDLQSRVKQTVHQAAMSLGVTMGVVKGDVVVNEGVPHIIEITTRLSGGYFCSHEIPLNTGVDFVGCVIKSALGEKVLEEELTPKYQKSVCQRYMFPEKGVVKNITGVDLIKHRNEVELCEMRVEIGEKLAELDNHTKRTGVIIVMGSDRQNAQNNAVSAINSIKIDLV